MTQVTLIDPQTAGVAGDMLLGALIDAGADLSAIEHILNLIPTHFSRCKSITLKAMEAKTHGFRSCRVELKIVEEQDETRAEELIQAIQNITDSSSLSDPARLFARECIRILTSVESQLHGVAISSTHLHEAGSVDTLADILGTAAACDSLDLFNGKIHCCPVAVGGGTVTFSHGTVSVPAPAVVEIARKHGIPLIGGPANEELATPTGMAILASMVDTFVDYPPAIVPMKVGYGAGSKELPNSPNFLRVIIGQTPGQDFDQDSVKVIETNLDDVSGEVVGSALQRILDAGAKDVWITPAQFKKNRPGYILHALCTREDLGKMCEIIFKETGTLGVRFQDWNRFILGRHIVTVKVKVGESVFDARVKVARDRSGKILRSKPEFDDVESISRATSRPVNEILSLVREAAENGVEEKTAD